MVVLARCNIDITTLGKRVRASRLGAQIDVRHLVFGLAICSLR